MTGFWLIIAGLTFASVGYLLHSIWTEYSPVKLASVCLALPFACSLLYHSWGGSMQLADAIAYKKKSTQLAENVPHYGSRKSVLRLMEGQVKSRPKEPRGWYLLGKIYLGGGDADNAIRCLKKAHELNDSNIEVITLLAQAQLLKHHNQLPEDTKQALKAVLKQAPKYAGAINLLGVDAFNRKDYAQAVRYWERIMPQFDPETIDGKALFDMIAKAQKLRNSAAAS